MEASEETGVSISNGAEEKSNKTAGESEKKENVKETDSQESRKRIRGNSGKGGQVREPGK